MTDEKRNTYTAELRNVISTLKIICTDTSIYDTETLENAICGCAEHLQRIADDLDAEPLKAEFELKEGA